jgi:hypothetical protein
VVSNSDEGNRFANVPKDWMDELSSQHRESGCGVLTWLLKANGIKIYTPDTWGESGEE